MSYSNYITKNLTGSNTADGKKLCVFCHFDKDKKIDNYVVFYLQELVKAGCDIVFVSSCSDIADEYLDKIKNLTKKIILRQNSGYDFACYMTGFLEAEHIEKYEKIIFANDSVYGPFYSLDQVFKNNMEGKFDVWSITDSVCPFYHLQSYFLCFNNTESIRKFLNNFFDGFIYTDNKEQVIINYELGLSRKLIENNFSIGAMCEVIKVIANDYSNIDDPKLKILRDKQKDSLVAKNRFSRLFSLKKKRIELIRADYDLYSVPQYTSWYSYINYFKCPFIKVNLLSNIKYFKYHMFMYNEVLANKYPEFPLNLLENHQKRVRDFDFRKIVRK